MGTKRFTDKSGEYYLKNVLFKKTHETDIHKKLSLSNPTNIKDCIKKCKGILPLKRKASSIITILPEFSLTPIPTMKKTQIQSNYEVKALSDAERTAVHIRRLEYSKEINKFRRNQCTEMTKLRKILFIQNWWRCMFKVIQIQKWVRGYFLRKKILNELKQQELIINKTLYLELLLRKIFCKPPFELMKTLFFPRDKKLLFLFRKKYSHILKSKMSQWKKNASDLKKIQALKRCFDTIMKNAFLYFLQKAKPKILPPKVSPKNERSYRPKMGEQEKNEASRKPKKGEKVKSSVKTVVMRKRKHKDIHHYFKHWNDIAWRNHILKALRLSKKRNTSGPTINKFSRKGSISVNKTKVSRKKMKDFSLFKQIIEALIPKKFKQDLVDIFKKVGFYLRTKKINNLNKVLEKWREFAKRSKVIKKIALGTEKLEKLEKKMKTNHERKFFNKLKDCLLQQKEEIIQLFRKNQILKAKSIEPYFYLWNDKISRRKILKVLARMKRNQNMENSTKQLVRAVEVFVKKNFFSKLLSYSKEKAINDLILSLARKYKLLGLRKWAERNALAKAQESKNKGKEKLKNLIHKKSLRKAFIRLLNYTPLEKKKTNNLIESRQVRIRKEKKHYENQLSQEVNPFSTTNLYQTGMMTNNRDYPLNINQINQDNTINQKHWGSTLQEANNNNNPSLVNSSSYHGFNAYYENQISNAKPKNTSKGIIYKKIVLKPHFISTQKSTPNFNKVDFQNLTMNYTFESETDRSKEQSIYSDRFDPNSRRKLTTTFEQIHNAPNPYNEGGLTTEGRLLNNISASQISVDDEPKEKLLPNRPHNESIEYAKLGFNYSKFKSLDHIDPNFQADNKKEITIFDIASQYREVKERRKRNKSMKEIGLNQIDSMDTSREEGCKDTLTGPTSTKNVIQNKFSGGFRDISNGSSHPMESNLNPISNIKIIFKKDNSSSSSDAFQTKAEIEEPSESLTKLSQFNQTISQPKTPTKTKSQGKIIKQTKFNENDRSPMKNQEKEGDLNQESMLIEPTPRVFNKISSSFESSVIKEDNAELPLKTKVFSSSIYQKPQISSGRINDSRNIMNDYQNIEKKGNEIQIKEEENKEIKPVDCENLKRNFVKSSIIHGQSIDEPEKEGKSAGEIIGIKESQPAIIDSKYSEDRKSSEPTEISPKQFEDKKSSESTNTDQKKFEDNNNTEPTNSERQYSEDKNNNESTNNDLKQFEDQKSSESINIDPKQLEDQKSSESTNIEPKQLEDQKSSESTNLGFKKFEDKKDSESTNIDQKVPEDNNNIDSINIYSKHFEDQKGNESTSIEPKKIEDQKGSDTTNIYSKHFEDQKGSTPVNTDSKQFEDQKSTEPTKTDFKHFEDEKDNDSTKIYPKNSEDEKDSQPTKVYPKNSEDQKSNESASIDPKNSEAQKGSEITNIYHKHSEDEKGSEPTKIDFKHYEDEKDNQLSKVDNKNTESDEKDNQPIKVDDKNTESNEKDNQPTKVDNKNSEDDEKGDQPTKVDNKNSEDEKDNQPTKEDHKNSEDDERDNQPTRVDHKNNEGEEDNQLTKIDNKSIENDEGDNRPTKIDNKSIESDEKDNQPTKADRKLNEDEKDNQPAKSDSKSSEDQKSSEPTNLYLKNSKDKKDSELTNLDLKHYEQYEDEKDSERTKTDPKNSEEQKESEPIKIDSKGSEIQKGSESTKIDSKNDEGEKDSQPIKIDSKNSEDQKDSQPIKTDSKNDEDGKDSQPTKTDLKNSENLKASESTKIDPNNTEYEKGSEPTNIDSKHSENEKVTEPTKIVPKNSEDQKDSEPTIVNPKDSETQEGSESKKIEPKLFEDQKGNESTNIIPENPEEQKGSETKSSEEQKDNETVNISSKHFEEQKGSEPENISSKHSEDQKGSEPADIASKRSELQKGSETTDIIPKHSEDQKGSEPADIASKHSEDQKVNETTNIISKHFNDKKDSEITNIVSKHSEEQKDNEPTNIDSKQSEDQKGSETVNIASKHFNDKKDSEITNIIPEHSEEDKDNETTNLVTKNTEEQKGNETVNISPKHSEDQKGSEPTDIASKHSEDQKDNDTINIISKHFNDKKDSETENLVNKHSEEQKDNEPTNIDSKHSELQKGSEIANIASKHFEDQKGSETTNIIPKNSEEDKDNETKNISSKHSEDQKGSEPTDIIPNHSEDQKDNESANISAKHSEDQKGSEPADITSKHSDDEKDSEMTTNIISKHFDDKKDSEITNIVSKHSEEQKDNEPTNIDSKHSEEQKTSEPTNPSPKDTEDQKGSEPISLGFKQFEDKKDSNSTNIASKHSEDQKGSNSANTDPEYSEEQNIKDPTNIYSKKSEGQKGSGQITGASEQSEEQNIKDLTNIDSKQSEDQKGSGPTDVTSKQSEEQKGNELTDINSKPSEEQKGNEPTDINSKPSEEQKDIEPTISDSKPSEEQKDIEPTISDSKQSEDQKGNKPTNITSKQSEDQKGNESTDITLKQSEEQKGIEPTNITLKQSEEQKGIEPTNITLKQSEDQKVSGPTDIASKQSEDLKGSGPTDTTSKQSEEQKSNEPTDITSKQSEEQKGNKPADIASKPSEDQKGTEPTDVTSKQSEDQEDNKPTDIASKPSEDQKGTEPTDITSKQSEDQKGNKSTGIASRPSEDQEDNKPIDIASRPSEDQKGNETINNISDRYGRQEELKSPKTGTINHPMSNDISQNKSLAERGFNSERCTAVESNLDDKNTEDSKSKTMNDTLHDIKEKDDMNNLEREKTAKDEECDPLKVKDTTIVQPITFGSQMHQPKDDNKLSFPEMPISFKLSKGNLDSLIRALSLIPDSKIVKKFKYWRDKIAKKSIAKKLVMLKTNSALLKKFFRLWKRGKGKKAQSNKQQKKDISVIVKNIKMNSKLGKIMSQQSKKLKKDLLGKYFGKWRKVVRSMNEEDKKISVTPRKSCLRTSNSKVKPTTKKPTNSQMLYKTQMFMKFITQLIKYNFLKKFCEVSSKKARQRQLELSRTFCKSYNTTYRTKTVSFADEEPSFIYNPKQNLKLMDYFKSNNNKDKIKENEDCSNDTSNVSSNNGSVLMQNAKESIVPRNYTSQTFFLEPVTQSDRDLSSFRPMKIKGDFYEMILKEQNKLTGKNKRIQVTTACSVKKIENAENMDIHEQKKQEDKIVEKIIHFCDKDLNEKRIPNKKGGISRSMPKKKKGFSTAFPIDLSKYSTWDLGNDIVGEKEEDDSVNKVMLIQDFQNNSRNISISNPANISFGSPTALNSKFGLREMNSTQYYKTQTLKVSENTGKLKLPTLQSCSDKTMRTGNKSNPRMRKIAHQIVNSKINSSSVS